PARAGRARPGADPLPRPREGAGRRVVQRGARAARVPRVAGLRHGGRRPPRSNHHPVWLATELVPRDPTTLDHPRQPGNSAGGAVRRLAAADAEADRLDADGGHRPVHNDPGGLRHPDLCRHGPPWAKLGLLLEQEPMAGALTDDRPTTAPRPDALKADRRVKIALLVGSGVTLVFLIVAMVRENFLSEWRFHQRHYRQLLLDSPDERQRRLGENFSVEMRQIDLPQFGTRDRCVSCHLGIDNPVMAKAPQPHRTHPGDFLKHHPVEKYGCTI